MDIVQRVQAILLKPKDEWVKIKAEPATVQGLYTSYIMILAAIPAVCQLIGYSLIGRRLPVVGMVRWSIGHALGYAIVSYLFALATVYIVALVVNELAPNFASTKNFVSALKLAAYSMTPGWVAGVFYLIPALGILGLLAGLYGLYVLYLGFDTPMMETPKDRVVGYLLVSIVVVIVLWVVFGLILGGIFAVRAFTL